LIIQCGAVAVASSRTMESIYNLVPEQFVEPPKPPMYRSKHDPAAPVTGSTFGTHGNTQLHGAGMVKKRETATFGHPGKLGPNPKEFLKRGEKAVKIPARNPDLQKFNYPEDQRKVYVPKRDEKPVMGLKTSKNFITANAVEAILQVPKLSGSTEPDYLKKADYGSAPAYLGQVKEEIRRENEMIDAYVKEQMGYEEHAGEKLDPLSEEERHELITALKKKWDAVNQKYQRMCHMVKLDTVGKVKRKEGMENELKQLEADIEKLERPGPVYVVQ